MAYTFNGTDQYIHNASSSPVSTTPCTLACWFRATVNNGDNLVQVSDSSGNNSHRIGLYSTNNSFRIGSTANGTNSNADGTEIISLNIWNHLCGVFTSTTSRTGYLNGSNAVTNTTSRSPTGFSRTLIGVRRNASTFQAHFPGQIAEVGIWSAALTAAEINSLASGVGCSLIRPQSLVFYAPLVRNIFDYTDAKLALTNNNTATVSDLHPRIYL